MKPAVVVQSPQTNPSVTLLHGDLDQPTFERALSAGVVAWDVETTGLDWRTERIGTVQLQIDELSCVVLVQRRIPRRLKLLLETQTVMKIFHHAMFDLRFAAYHWKASPARVACTKIASKLAHPQAPPDEHSLSRLVYRYFDIELDKSLRISDWTGNLSQEQLAYAVNDVRYLQPLYTQLDESLRRKRQVGLRERCYTHLPTRVELELGGYPDVYEY